MKAISVTESTPPGSAKLQLLERFGCGPTRFNGSEDAIYDRHLLFDNIVGRSGTTPRDGFEAAAGSVRDILSQRCILTNETYEKYNPKRVNYLSMEFLIGRSLANNLLSLLIDDPVEKGTRTRGLEFIELLEYEPDAGLGNGGLGRLAACFMDSAMSGSAIGVEAPLSVARNPMEVDPGRVVKFGTGGHRCGFPDQTFTETHIRVVAQAGCD